MIFNSRAALGAYCRCVGEGLLSPEECRISMELESSDPLEIAAVMGCAVEVTER